MVGIEHIPYDSVFPAMARLTWQQKFLQQPLQGFSLATLFKVLRQNSFQVDRQYVDKLFYLLFVATFQSVLGFFERWLLAERIASTEVLSPPLFLLGHWRNGTTFLHNLLCQDPNHGYVRAYQALVPGSFLLPGLRELLGRFDKFIVLKTRPMDNVTYGLHEPWEDEFLMAAMTGISPYIRAMFPRIQGREAGYKYPDFRSVEERQQWKESFGHLLKRLTVVENKRLVLKSPSHTARVKTLLELFPEAKLIHIIRHPYDVFPSNLKLWQNALARSFFQSVTHDEIVEIVLSTYEKVYERYHKDKSYIPGSNLVEIRFEDLERDPLAQLRNVYDYLHLPDFDVLASRVEGYLKALSNYKKNVLELAPPMKKIVRERWWQNFEVYGYDD